MENYENSYNEYETGPKGGGYYKIRTKTITDKKNKKINLICEVEIDFKTLKGEISKKRNNEYKKAIEKSKGINPIWYYINELKKEIIKNNQNTTIKNQQNISNVSTVTINNK